MSVSEPSKILTPWATSGLKNTIPPTANPVTGNAGYDQGFPAINMTAKEAGGSPPFGQDFNGILFSITEILRYVQAGGLPSFSASMASAVGGYSKGAIVLGGDGVTVFQNTIDGNTTNPDSGGAGWVGDVLSGYPVGAPIPWPVAVPPSGYIIMTGQSFSATTYPRLAQAYPSLVLPDMRAEFIRGWDNGRGIDSGRVIRSAQGDAIRNIVGSLNDVYGGPVMAGSGAMNGVFMENSAQSYQNGSSIFKRVASGLFDASRVVPTANDNRPRNIAFNYIVRAA